MNVILFGATGLAGSALLDSLLQAGHQVTAFVRNPSKIKTTHASLHVIEGDVLNEEEVAAAVNSTCRSGPTTRSSHCGR